MINQIYEDPKFLVIGTGSIGKRHINNLSDLGYSCDAISLSGKAKIEDIPKVVNLVGLEEAIFGSEYQAVIIACETSKHVPLALRVAKSKKSLFIEKPLSDSLEGLLELTEHVSKNKLIVEIGFTLRNHPSLQFVRQYLANEQLGKIHYSRAIVGHDLRRWRTKSDHRNGYSATRQGGGGVLLDLSHEVDLLYWLFGEVTEVSAMESYDDSLDIETESCVHAQLAFKTGQLAQVSLDYLRQDYTRQLEIVGSYGTLYWDFKTSKVIVAKTNGVLEQVYSIGTVYNRNDMFVAHTKLFAERVKGLKSPAISSLDDGIYVQKLLQAIRDSINTKQSIRIL